MKNKNIFFAAISALSLLIIVAVTLKSLNFSKINFAVPDFVSSNYASDFVEIRENSFAGQTLITDYTNLSAVGFRFNFENFTGKIFLHIAATSNPDLELARVEQNFNSETSTKFVDLAFEQPLEGREFFMYLTLEKSAGSAYVGIIPRKDSYPQGQAIFESAAKGDDLIFNSYSTYSLRTLALAKQDLLQSVQKDTEFFVFYTLLIFSLAAVIVFIWYYSSHRDQFN